MLELPPRLHLFHHVVLDVIDATSFPSGRNPWADANWLDEDGVGKAMKLVKKVHVGSMAKRFIDRYLATILPKLCGV